MRGATARSVSPQLRLSLLSMWWRRRSGSQEASEASRPRCDSDLPNRPFSPSPTCRISPTVPFLSACPTRKCLLAIIYALFHIWHGRGHRFDPDQVHQQTLKIKRMPEAVHSLPSTTSCHFVSRVQKPCVESGLQLTARGSRTPDCGASLDAPGSSTRPTTSLPGA